MIRKLVIFAFGACLLTTPALAQGISEYGTQTQLRGAGFSDSFISRLKRNTGKTYNQTSTAKSVYGQDASGSMAATPGTPVAIPNKADITDNSGGGLKPTDFVVPSNAQASEPGTAAPAPAPAPETPLDSPPATEEPKKNGTLPPLPPPDEIGKTDGKSETPKSTNGNGKTKSPKKKTKKAKKGYSSAPVVQSLPYAQEVLSPPPAVSNYGSQEIYSQEPMSLPSVAQLPTPSRTTLPPISRDSLMETPLGEAISRVLGCNFMGLTGLIHTTGADVSKEGSFKMGFHTNWFNLERVYDRVLATGESGKIFEAPLFFNYAPTNDLEFALMLPIMDYTIQSRILWPVDFRESGLGDTKLSFKYRVFDNPQYQMRGAFGLGFKFPTGKTSNGIGTGQTDFEVFTAFSKNFEKVIAHLNLGYIMTGDPNTRFYPNGLADIFYYNIGIEYPHNHNVTVGAEVNGVDWGAEGLKLDVAPMIRYTPTENFALDLSVPISVVNEQRYGYNYRATVGVTAFFK